MAARSDDTLSSHIVDAISGYVSGVRASTVVRCCDSLQGGDDSFAVRMAPRLVCRIRAKSLADAHRSCECEQRGCVGRCAREGLRTCGIHSTTMGSSLCASVLG